MSTDVDGQGADLGVFLFLADLLTLRDGGCLILQLPPQHSWPSEGDRLEALAKGDRLSLLRLQLVPRGDLLNWRLPTDGASGAPASGPLEIVWREPRRQALPPRFASGNAAVPTVVIDAHGGLVPDPQAWLYCSLAVSDDGLVRAAGRPTSTPTPPMATTWCRWVSRNRCPSALTCRPSGTRWMAAPSVRAICPTWAWHTSTSTTTNTKISSPAPPCRWGCVRAWWMPTASAAATVPLARVRPPVGQKSNAPSGWCSPPPPSWTCPRAPRSKWVEREARSLAEHRAYLQQLEEAMRRDALIHVGGLGPARTELEISLTAGQSFAVLQSLAGQKSSMLSTLLRQWTRLTGEKLSDTPACSVEICPLVPPQPPRKPQPSLQEWLVLHERGVIDGAELRQQLGLADRAD